MKILSGQDIADYVKERQVHEVAHLRHHKILPKLVIFYDNDSPVITKYMDLKKSYGADIGVSVEIDKLSPENAENKLNSAAKTPTVHGIIIQLPLKTIPSDILKLIPAPKDVDGLNDGFDSATAEAINWLINGYNIDLKDKKIAIVGRGQLVGAPLEKMWQNSGHHVTVFEKGDNLNKLASYDLIVTATGIANLIKSEMLKPGATIIDAGTASENGVLRGDLDPTARTRQDLTLTPKIGGVGPLTVTTLFDHTIQAAKAKR
ncbi:MAG: bifunctional 5,10-methylenetetrahydrofolate dehydrogenase/5,10-methenyltetrahydrofolate cyclohydrolase [Candidatus Nomurabacteria bacterium]|jgi:methylenetetrahydrofolate dehydrogenase (NADP+)/methenyltetrahydrofolate cyclohydrolase|nr:bifunctional 5,10-methylenetetrahydrofolate dehydrogenase/5,10-methenyltetrahydrofolate cyclohydrolase [Candidatus Nomurabacteria bacterium]